MFFELLGKLCQLCKFRIFCVSLFHVVYIFSKYCTVRVPHKFIKIILFVSYRYNCTCFRYVISGLTRLGLYSILNSFSMQSLTPTNQTNAVHPKILGQMTLITSCLTATRVQFQPSPRIWNPIRSHKCVTTRPRPNSLPYQFIGNYSTVGSLYKVGDPNRPDNRYNIISIEYDDDKGKKGMTMKSGAPALLYVKATLINSLQMGSWPCCTRLTP